MHLCILYYHIYFDNYFALSYFDAMIQVRSEHLFNDVTTILALMSIYLYISFYQITLIMGKGFLFTKGVFATSANMKAQKQGKKETSKFAHSRTHIYTHIQGMDFKC